MIPPSAHVVEAGRVPGHRPLLVISPHLDDAVLSLRRTLRRHPGSLVVTVLAGTPAQSMQLQPWDRRAGYASAGEAVRARREEDVDAAAVLDLRVRHLPFLDGQYVSDHEDQRDDLVNALAEQLGDHAAELQPYGPVGIHHPDHIMVGDAFLDAADAVGLAQVHLYEEIPYRCDVDSTERRLAGVGRAGWRYHIEIAPSAPHDDVTDAALDSYRSQRPMMHEWDVRQDERMWRLTRSTGATDRHV